MEITDLEYIESNIEFTIRKVRRCNRCNRDPVHSVNWLGIGKEQISVHLKHWQPC